MPSVALRDLEEHHLKTALLNGSPISLVDAKGRYLIKVSEYLLWSGSGDANRSGEKNGDRVLRIEVDDATAKDTKGLLAQVRDILNRIDRLLE